MLNLWEIITNNSSLPVQAGNSLWDHLNNQQGGNVLVFGELDIELEMADFEVEIEADYIIEFENDFVVELEDTEYEVEICT